MHPSKICSRQTRKKKKDAVTYYLTIVYSSSLSLFLYGLYPSNTRPTKVFKARSEEGAKSCVSYFNLAYTAYKALIKAKKDERAINCDL